MIIKNSSSTQQIIRKANDIKFGMDTHKKRIKSDKLPAILQSLHDMGVNFLIATFTQQSIRLEVFGCRIQIQKTEHFYLQNLPIWTCLNTNFTDSFWELTFACTAASGWELHGMPIIIIIIIICTELYDASILMLLRKKVPQTRGNPKSCD